MEHHVGIDVSLELSSLCVLDATGKVIREAKVASEPEALVKSLRGLDLTIVRVGLEAGPLSQWPCDGLHEAGFEAVLLGRSTAPTGTSMPRCRRWRSRRTGGTHAGSSGCCAWGGIGRCIASQQACPPWLVSSRPAGRPSCA